MKKLLLILALVIIEQKCFSQISIQMKKNGGVWNIPCKVNDIETDFIYDTGASDVSISTELLSLLIKNGSISENDFLGKGYARFANGETSEIILLNIDKIVVGGYMINNISASCIKGLNVPLLLGQSALSKLGEITTDLETGIFSFNKTKNTLYDFKDYTNCSNCLTFEIVLNRYLYDPDKEERYVYTSLENSKMWLNHKEYRYVIRLNKDSSVWVYDFDETLSIKGLWFSPINPKWCKDGKPEKINENNSRVNEFKWSYSNDSLEITLKLDSYIRTFKLSTIPQPTIEVDYFHEVTYNDGYRKEYFSSGYVKNISGDLNIISPFKNDKVYFENQINFLMKKKIVDYMFRGEFEKEEKYYERISDSNLKVFIDNERYLIKNKIIEEFKNDFDNSKLVINKYNPDKEYFIVQYPFRIEKKLSIPIEKAKSFKNDFNEYKKRYQFNFEFSNDVIIIKNIQPK